MNDRDNQNQELADPEKLRAALSRLCKHSVVVPPELDNEILRTASEHLKPLADKSKLTPKQVSDRETFSWTGWCAGLLDLFGGRRWAAPGAVAVAMIAVGMLAWLGQHPRLAMGPEDLNGDGVVDMLDAFALARELQLTPASHPHLDLNGDGVTNEDDVKVLAAQAVRIDPQSRS